MKVGDYVRTRTGYIAKYKGIEQYLNINGENEDWFVFDSTIIDGYEDIVPVEINKKYFVKSSPNILDLLEPHDLLYIDIDGGYAGGIIVPRIAETLAELDRMKEKITDGDWLLKGIVTYEQLESMEYRIGE